MHKCLEIPKKAGAGSSHGHERNCLTQHTEDYDSIPLNEPLGFEGGIYVTDYDMAEPEIEIPSVYAYQEVIDSLISQAQHTHDALESFTVNEHRSLPYFQRELLRSLKKSSYNLGPTKASRQLLRLAYAGHSHLNWVAFDKITYEGIAAAAESEELKDACALRLCIDNIGGNPHILIAALS